MKTLYLIRHAKSSWKNPDLEDFDRPLNKRGKRDAPLMGQHLRKSGVRPDWMLSSPAKRALKTAKTIAKEIGYPKHNIATDQTIYLADVQTLLELIQQFSDEYRQVALFGHNPGFTELANGLTNAQIDNVPTCAIVTIGFSVTSWKEIQNGRGELMSFDYPKKLLR